WLAWRSTAAGRTMAEANSWLSPLLYRALIENGVPESEIPELRATYQATRARNQTLLGIARKMAEQFQDAGISFMFIKGSAMLAGHYRDPGVRVISDVDLLVRED